MRRAALPDALSYASIYALSLLSYAPIYALSGALSYASRAFGICRWRSSSAYPLTSSAWIARYAMPAAAYFSEQSWHADAAQLSTAVTPLAWSCSTASACFPLPTRIDGEKAAGDQAAGRLLDRGEAG